MRVLPNHRSPVRSASSDGNSAAPQAAPPGSIRLKEVAIGQEVGPSRAVSLLGPEEYALVLSDEFAHTTGLHTCTYTSLRTTQYIPGHTSTYDACAYVMNEEAHHGCQPRRRSGPRSRPLPPSALAIHLLPVISHSHVSSVLSLGTPRALYEIQEGGI